MYLIFFNPHFSSSAHMFPNKNKFIFFDALELYIGPDSPENKDVCNMYMLSSPITRFPESNALCF